LRAQPFDVKERRSFADRFRQPVGRGFFEAVFPLAACPQKVSPTGLKESSLRKRVQNLSFIALFLAAGLPLVSCGKKKDQGFERPPAPVTTAVTVQHDVPVYLDEVGKCVAREVVTIQPQVSGRITELHFTDGANVNKGDLLFTIDPRPFQAQLDAAEANLTQAKAAADFAKVQYERGAKLIETKAIALQEYDQRKNALDVGLAQVEQGMAAVATARLNLQYCSIHSPIDGLTGRRLVDVGNVVTANNTPLLTIQRLDPIYADFTVTENDLTAVQQNMKRGSLQVEVTLPDEPEKPVAGALTFLDNAVQNTTGTVNLRATVPNHDHRLWPGRFVKVRLVLSTLPGAVLVPAAAPQMSANGQFVYVIKDDGTADFRPVTTGQRQGDLIVVEKGLKAGEQVIVTGQIGVAPGGKVHVLGPEGKNAAPSEAAKGGGKS
jgi:multidrug efflux system membrane fusion protein